MEIYNPILGYALLNKKDNKNNFFPLKSKRANAYAAGIQIKAETTVTTAANTNEVAIDDNNELCENTNCHHLNPNSCGIADGASYLFANANINRFISGK